jgi:hypothetical protein
MYLLSIPRLVVMAILLVFAVSTSADYYKWTDEHGVIQFSDQPPGPNGKPVRPNGTTVIPMRENIRTQKRVQQIKNPKPVLLKIAPASTRVVESNSQWEKEKKLREEKRQQLQCKNYKERISWIDSRLRAGGYSVDQGNRLRGERREVSSKLAWECLRD